MKTLKELYELHHGKVSDKWSIYLSEYERLLREFRDSPVNLLEIGIQNGGSLEIWAEFLKAHNRIIGCDINTDCARLEYADPRIVVVIGDANQPEVEREIARHAESLHIVIDDGSHRSGDIIKSFLLYFPKLIDGGIFIAEDLHCSYWQEFDGGLHYPHSSMAFFKALADIVNREHWGVSKTGADLLRGFYEHYDCEPHVDISASIHSVEFVNSVCIVRKMPAAQNILGPRVIAGCEEIVAGGSAAMQQMTIDRITPDQSANKWSIVESASAAQWEKQWEETKALRASVAVLNDQIGAREQQIAALTSEVEQYERQLAGLQQAVQRYESEANGLRAELADDRQAFDRYEHQIAGLRNDVVRRDVRMLRLQGDINALVSSTSWRLTAPLRRSVTQMLRVRHVASVGMRSVRANGGLKAAVRKATELYSKEGLSGLRSRLAGRAGAASARQNDYDRWIQTYDLMGDQEREAIRERIAAMPSQPLISVIMPTYNPKAEWLKEAIESVRMQLYPHWELCIADDLSSDLTTRSILEEYRQKDSRIKVVFREQNGHISAASNSALGVSDGDWIALLDHDDLLPEHALYCVAKAIIANPEASLFYSDEDKIDASGRRYDPYFKCDWNLDLFYSQNMFCHLGVFKRELVEAIGGFRVGLEGSQDYDLVLRCVERAGSKAVRHIPHVLYHWRAHSESTAKNVAVKPYAAVAGERALNEHFTRQDVVCRVEWVGNGYRAFYGLPATLPLVSLIIPTRNGLDLIRRCIESIVDRTTYPNYEILIVDNGSDDPEVLQYFTSLSTDARIRVCRDDRPFNYSALNNQAALQAKGELLGLVNNDIEVISPDWLSEMVRLALQPSVGAVGARLLYPDDRLQHGGIVLGIGGVAGHANKYVRPPYANYFERTALISAFSAVTAACLIVRRSVFQEVKGLNEKDLTVAFNDVDFCLRVAEAGYRNVCTPYAELYHYESATRGYEDDPLKRARFLSEMDYMRKRWGQLLAKDPCYSPNLSLEYEDFSLAWPPRVTLLD
ncbi:Glycosyltransferase, GT2 family [Burkholderia sp. GAS332]|nr:Glycosyltransferase, GT2 family [Burkholderia sp. GAS332]